MASGIAFSTSRPPSRPPTPPAGRAGGRVISRACIQIDQEPYFGTVINFRFTTLGFFLAAVGLIVSAEVPTRPHALLLLLVAAGGWIVEMRNRSIFRELAERGIEIERDTWGYRDADAYKPFYSRMLKSKPSADTGSPKPSSRTKVFFWEFDSKHLSHTLGIDLIFLGVIVFALWQAWKIEP